MHLRNFQGILQLLHMLCLDTFPGVLSEYIYSFMWLEGSSF